MDTLENYRQIIERILTEYAAVPYAFGDLHSEVVFDRKHDRYLIVIVGWDGDRRVHGCTVHMDIIDGKIWIQRDGTEYGMADDLTSAGIPKEHIVLGFREAELRKYTGYALY
jgi:hypothetical protein